ncbi:hypothetical protein At1D1609_55170 (plasmid) [Agrobacterium tumefaciens]|uniref:Uncharacterized protein n=1 Tax=Agrobacterium tumefaciens TaxID=358 RepID=A0A2L2LMU4_AGRTU|nr:hypothetical protein At1D1609_55170 [Agrobacterium tumefaciens]
MKSGSLGGNPRVVDDIARSPGSTTEDFMNRAVETSKRYRKAKGAALVLGAFENWEIG